MILQSQHTKHVRLGFLDIPEELDFCEYENIVVLEILFRRTTKQTAKLSHHPNLQYLTFGNARLRPEPDYRKVFLIESVDINNKIPFVSLYKNSKRNNRFPSLKNLCIFSLDEDDESTDEDESTEMSKKALQYIATNADQLQKISFYEETFDGKLHNESVREEAKKEWIESMIEPEFDEE